MLGNTIWAVILYEHVLQPAPGGPCRHLSPCDVVRCKAMQDDPGAVLPFLPCLYSLRSAQASQQRQSKPDEAQKPASKQPFGSAAAAAPAFGNPSPQPAQVAGGRQAGSQDDIPAERSSSAGPASGDQSWHDSSSSAGTPQPDQGPFGMSTGVFCVDSPLSASMWAQPSAAAQSQFCS